MLVLARFLNDVVMDGLIFLLCFCNSPRFGLHKTRFNAENRRWTAHSYNHSPYNNDDQTHKTREILNKLHTRKKQKGLEDKRKLNAQTSLSRLLDTRGNRQRVTRTRNHRTLKKPLLAYIQSRNCSNAFARNVASANQEHLNRAQRSLPST